MCIRDRYKIDDNEQQFLKNWIESDAENKYLHNKVLSPENISDKFSVMDTIDVEKSLLNNKRTLKEKSRRKNIKQLLAYISSAAAIIIIAFSIWNITYKPAINNTNKIALMSPGSNKAKLILANGKEVILDNSTNMAIKESNVNVNIKNNKVIYTPSNQNETTAINKIVTPHGGEYALTLSDGTKVWLNSLSELKFPTVFNGKKRIVELKGEAYFEVAENKEKPFIVKLDNYDVKVLGTKFNINNYSNSSKSKTTLCSGKVEILPVNKNIKPIILKPGNQLTLTKQKQDFKVVNTDTEIYTAWMYGYYYFINSPLEEILESLSRWYKMEVFFINKEAKTRLFTGKFSRYDNLNTIIKIIEEGSNLKFRINKNNIYIE